MTKSLQQIQQENRKFILEAIHGCSYEEALQKEWGENCIIEDCILNGSEMASWGRVIKDNRHKSLYANIDSGNQLEFSINWDDDFKCTIIGKPITLNRVLKAIDPFGNYGYVAKHICKVNRINATYKFLFEWNPELETLEEQTEETQRAINKLFND